MFSRAGTRLALLLVRCAISPSPGREVFELEEGVGEGLSAGGTAMGCKIVAMLCGRAPSGVVGYDGRCRYQTGVGGGSSLAV